MKEITLTHNKVALVDDEDFNRLNEWAWSARKGKNGKWYAHRSNGEKNPTVHMHREIMGAKEGEQVDHWNGNGLDNRRENLRLCSNQQNSQNRGLGRNSSTGFKGVTWHKGREKYRAYIKVNGRQIHIGYYKTSIEAAQAYDGRAVELFGRFARINLPTF